METPNTILPLIGSLAGVLLTGMIGVATYSWQEKAKRQTELTERRQKLYEDLNGALFGLILAKTRADRRRILADIEKGWLFASDQVLADLFTYSLYLYGYLRSPLGQCWRRDSNPDSDR
jgi:hypothetical protein